ncbi:MAG TPA: LysM peptidoglycan-binding domain-containing protein [Anaerolineales bacterium]|nr:LysM peptidoglycan-binding domain-containing protein [Anaerolineales bacterium]
MLFRRAYLLILGTWLVVTGCVSPGPIEPTATGAPGVTLTPYIAAVTSATRTPAPGRIASPTPLPTPTATPYRYTIVEGDTLLGIAFRFGLTLADLLAANPGVDPQFLSIGDELIIPLLDNPAAAAAVPTPVGFVVPAGPVDCYPAADGSLWCFLQFENIGEQRVEGLSVQVTVYDAAGEAVGVRTALPPVNLLPPGLVIPLAAWFPGAGADYAAAAAFVLSALPVPPEDTRYLPVSVEYTVEPDGPSAPVSGMVAGPDDRAVSAFRIGIAAMDVEGRVVGLRVLELAGPGPSDFETVVYSLAGDIDQVLVYAEAYP